jgi:tRNA pseudouridine38-40 synthase
MARFRLLIEYAGTRYSGWQIQKNARTVAGEIERAVRDATGERTFELYGAGRTDAGVHALGQVAHLDIRTSQPPETLRRRVNDGLPSDINLLDAIKVPHRFHARHTALSRAYLYQIARRRTAFFKPFVWWIKEDLDVDRMRRAARGFAGRRDFAGFTDDDQDEKSTVVQVERCEIVEHGDLMVIHVAGSHFLWKMVRRMVGVLAAVGRGELPDGDVPQLLNQPSGLPARLTAPASGLFLARVEYPGDPPGRPVEPPLSFGPGIG